MMPHWRITVVFAVIFWAALMQSSAGLENATFGQGLSLNVYLDNTGKALITGYAENVSGLEFLNASQFRFENDTRQLYALTDGLTTKVGDLWTIRFDARGGFDDYHVTFYLPSDIRMGMINTAKVLDIFSQRPMSPWWRTFRDTRSRTPPSPSSISSLLRPQERCPTPFLHFPAAMAILSCCLSRPFW